MSKCKAASSFPVVALGALASLPALLHAQQQDKFNVEQVAQFQVPRALEDGPSVPTAPTTAGRAFRQGLASGSRRSDRVWFPPSVAGSH